MKQTRPFYKKWWFIALVAIIIIGAIGRAIEGEDSVAESPTPPKIETAAENPDEAKAKEGAETKQDNTWAEEISALSTNNDVASDKFYALEKFMMDYRSKVTTEEVEQFKKDIIEDYISGTYLSELDNHERMLSNIFKSYIIEQSSDGALKDFAFDYHQNLKYTYRGADAVDSAAVKSNEEQMDKALQEIK